MKKIIVSIFAFFYLGLSCGFASNMHFCMGRFSSVDLFKIDKSNCKKCGMKSRKGCCNSKLTVVKITDNQQASIASIHIFSPAEAYLQHNAFVSLWPLAQPINASFTGTSPPPVSGALLCILNSVFII
jgi:hypothetical protein